MSCNVKVLYPRNIVKDLPGWIRKNVAENESHAAMERIADEIMSDELLLTRYMKHYDISQHIIDNYDPVADIGNESIAEESLETEEEPEWEDEETFKKRMEDFEKELEISNIPFVSWHISTCCLEIALYIEELEINIKKKPHVGMLMEWNKNIPHKNLDGPIAEILYRNARSKFEKRADNERKR